MPEINFDVPIRNDRVINANIKGHILSRETMERHGFSERYLHWELKEKVSFIPTMEEYLYITIGKGTERVNITVYDEFMGEVYDYQQQIYDEDFHKYAYKIHHNVQDVMRRLSYAGIITGYFGNDYI